MASSSLQQMAPTLINRSKLLINNDLKKICREEGLAQSGVKATLQTRVIELINRAVGKNDHEMFNRLQHRIANNGYGPADSLSSSQPSHTSQSPLLPPHRINMSNGLSTTNGFHTQAQRSRPGYHFKESPFFELRELLLDNIPLEASPSHRQNCNKLLMLNDSICSRMKADSGLRLLLFSTTDQPLGSYTHVDVAFPSQIEVRVNGEEVRANFKGLKGKPGSTRPADITNFVRVNPANYRNSVLITYALTQKRYHVFIYMVRKFSVGQLVRRIQKRITNASVLRDMKQKASDADIVVGSSVMSLKDPISTLRISTPCRSLFCTHNQCFDAESFLQLQEQAPTWQCPICNKTISFTSLAVDEYVQEILKSVQKGTDQVTIEPDGQWSNADAKKASTNHDRENGAGSGDDDFVEIFDDRRTAIKAEHVPTPQSLMHTPPLQSREVSAAPRTGSKRMSEVIDLTLSDDDEDLRPNKRSAYDTHHTPPDPTPRYHAPFFGQTSVPMRPPALAQAEHSLQRPEPSAQTRHSFGGFQRPPPAPYAKNGSAQYPAYIGSSP